MSPSSRAACDSSNEAAGVRASRLGLHWWTRALRSAWQCLAGAGRYKWVDRCPDSDWLRRDIGLTEDVMTFRSDQIDEIR
ncbi:MAG TPA: hypothetical protein VF901_13825, partial [Bradyrhizobium sp.]